MFLNRRATVEKLVWGNKGHIDCIKSNYEPFDLIVGSDLLYDPRNYPCLLSTVVQFSQRNTVTILGGTKRLLERQLLPLASQHFDVAFKYLDVKNIYIFEFRHKH